MVVLGPQRKFQCKLQAAKEQLNRLKTCKGVEQTFFIIIRWKFHEVSPLYNPRNTHLKEQKHQTINRYTPFMTPFFVSLLQNKQHLLNQKSAESRGNLRTFCRRHPHSWTLQQRTKRRLRSMPSVGLGRVGRWMNLSIVWWSTHVAVYCMYIIYINIYLNIPIYYWRCTVSSIRFVRRTYVNKGIEQSS